MAQGQALTQSDNQGSIQPPSQPAAPAAPSNNDILAQLVKSQQGLEAQMALLTKTLTEE